MDEVVALKKARRYASARSVSARALNLAVLSHNDELAVQARYNMGYFSQFIGDYATALRYLHDAERSNPYTNETMRHDIYQHLSQTYAALDSLSAAYYYATRYAELGDTLLNRDRAAALLKLALQFDAHAKRQAIENLEKEKSAVQTKAQEQQLVAAAIAVGMGAVILAMFFIIRDYRHRLRTGRVIATQKEELNQQKIRELEDSMRLENMQSVLAGQESERQRIAHDLHDSLGGLLAATKMHFENLSVKLPQFAGNEDLAKVKSLLDDTVTETREIARNLQPGALQEFGLVTAVRDLTGRVRGQGMPVITFQHFGDFSDLPHTVALNCYRIVQELLQNSLKHAQAAEILVQLTHTDKDLSILVEDDGIGFDPATVQKGMGNGNMAHRVQFLKGDLNVQTAPGQGTSTLVIIPILSATPGFP